MVRARGRTPRVDARAAWHDGTDGPRAVRRPGPGGRTARGPSVPSCHAARASTRGVRPRARTIAGDGEDRLLGVDGAVPSERPARLVRTGRGRGLRGRLHGL